MAFSILSDPTKKHQYDCGMDTGDLDGINIEEIGGVGRLFGAMFSKLGVPLPTQISPRVLSLARQVSSLFGIFRRFLVEKSEFLKEQKAFQFAICVFHSLQGSKSLFSGVFNSSNQ